MNLAISNPKNLGSMGHQNEMIRTFVNNTRHTIDNNNPNIAYSYSMQHFPNLLLHQCPKVAMIHHIDILKLKGYFHLFDKINSHAKACVVPNDFTLSEARKYIKVPLFKLPYWINEERLEPRDNLIIEKLKARFDKDEILIGSFQKDSEADTNQPKLCKGPDLFLDVVKTLSKELPIRVLLTGKGRRYIYENLIANNIRCTYFGNVKNINPFYDICDWYLITSRIEGGPMAALEAPYRKVKTLSLNVGIAPELLHEECICSDTNEMIRKVKEDCEHIEYNFNNINRICLPKIAVSNLDSLLETLI